MSEREYVIFDDNNNAVDGKTYATMQEAREARRAMRPAELYEGEAFYIVGYEGDEVVDFDVD